MKGYLGDIHVVHPHSTTVHIVKTAQQIDDGRLSRAGRSDDRKGFSRLSGEADVIQNLYAVLIAEIHMVERHFSGDRRHFYSVGSILDRHRLVDGLKDTLQIGNCRQKGIVKFASVVIGDQKRLI